MAEVVRGGARPIGPSVAARRARPLVALLGAALLAVSLAGERPGWAQGRSGTDEATPEEARLLREVEEATARRQELDGRVGELDDRIAEVSGELRVAESRLSAVYARQRTAEVKLDDTRQKLAAAEQAIRDQALAAYTGESDAGRIAGMLFRVQDVGELSAKRSYLRIVVSTQAEAIAAYQGLREKTEDLVGELNAARSVAQAERDVVRERRSELQDERDTQAALRRDVDAEIARRNQLIDVIRARQAEFQAPVIALQQQSAAVAGSLQERQSSSSSASSSGGRLAAPIPGAVVVSAYGGRVHPIYGDYRVHTGVDLSGGTGTPIRAAGDGVVLSAGWLGGYGQATIIEHGGPLATLYGHQSQILVRVGQRVSRGDIIGRVGCTGRCTGPHLHYEVRINGNPVNPTGYL